MINTKEKVIVAFLLAIAIILSQTVPTFNSIPDFNTIIMIILIILTRDYKRSLIYAVFLGSFAFLIPKAPNGQIPSIIDKFITVNVVYLFIIVFKNNNKKIFTIITLFIGLFISNSVFFTLYFYFSGIIINNYIIVLEVILFLLFSATINTMIGILILKLIKKFLKQEY